MKGRSSTENEGNVNHCMHLFGVHGRTETRSFTKAHMRETQVEIAGGMCKVKDLEHHLKPELLLHSAIYKQDIQGLDKVYPPIHVLY